MTGRRVLLATTLIAGSSWSAAAVAQSQPETIVVTATSTTPFELPAAIDKTGVAIGEIPRSIQVIPRELIDQQGGTLLKDTLRNVSGLTQGGQFAFGFYDRFISRGLNVSFLDDGLPDGTSDLGGYTHSLTAVARVEVLKGPGSALYGSSEPGGTINLVHARPTDTLFAAASEQYGSYDTSTTTLALSGPVADGVKARLDATYERSDGFRDQRRRIGEVYGTVNLTPANHDILLRFEYHRIETRPDSVGQPFNNLAGVANRPLDLPRDFKYYTPFAFADQTIKRIHLSDAWKVSDLLTVNLRGAYTDRDVDLARNSGGRLTAAGTGFSLTGRQLRAQTDGIHDLIGQAEPTWTFSTGGIDHVLVTGGEARKIDSHTQRATADLPNIANVFAPVTPETSFGALTFLCNASHSCNNADLDARFYGLYAIDQLSFGESLKVRLSARQNWFKTSAEGRSLIPRNPGSEHICNPPAATTCAFIPGQPVAAKDNPFAWDVGAVYFLTKGLSVFGGYSNNRYPIFNTEEPQSVGQVPEKGTQVEGGLRFQRGDWLSLSTALFKATRRNVFTILLVNGIDVSQVFSYRTKGWETDLNLHPTHAWSISGNLTIQQAKLIDYPQNPAQIGNHVPTVPWMLANAWTSYDINAGPAGTVQLAAGVRYREHEFTNTAQTSILPSSTQADLSAALLHGNWTARAGVKNVFDTRDYAYSAGTGSGGIPDQGRTFFVSLGVATR